MALWLVRSTPERAVRVRALAADIVLCSWARHLTLTVPLSTQVYKWVPPNLIGTLRYRTRCLQYAAGSNFFGDENSAHAHVGMSLRCAGIWNVNLSTLALWRNRE